MRDFQITGRDLIWVSNDTLKNSKTNGLKIKISINFSKVQNQKNCFVIVMSPRS